MRGVQEHFQQLVQNHTFPLEHVTTVQEAKIWMWMAHNMVNMRIGKVWIPSPYWISMKIMAVRLRNHGSLNSWMGVILFDGALATVKVPTTVRFPFYFEQWQRSRHP